MRRLLFYCQHTLGMGHLVRSREIVRELAREFEVTLLTGGGLADGFEFPEDVRLAHLPALEADPNFRGLRSCDASASLEETRERRRRRILELCESLRPDVLVTELFPFGRKKFSFELIPLLKRAREHGATVVCSLRDILVGKPDQAAYEQRVREIVNTYYDLILVHGDAGFFRLEETFSSVAGLRCEVRYTGYVAQGGGRGWRRARGARPVIVGSIGAGRCESGHDLLRGLIGAAGLLGGRLPHEFRIFAGPFIPDDVYARLRELAAGRANVTLEKFTPDLAAHLEAADLSVSMGGYNTLMDVLRAKVRALIYPVTANGDREQELRAQRLESLGAVEAITTAGLEPALLAAQIERALEKTPSAVALDLNGAVNSREILAERVHAYLG